MISEELKAIVDKFKEQGKMNFFDETTEEKILAFEKEKEVTLPSKYKEWMLFSDGGELFLPPVYIFSKLLGESSNPHKKGSSLMSRPIKQSFKFGFIFMLFISKTAGSPTLIFALRLTS